MKRLLGILFILCALFAKADGPPACPVLDSNFAPQTLFPGNNPVWIDSCRLFPPLNGSGGKIIETIVVSNLYVSNIYSTNITSTFITNLNTFVTSNAFITNLTVQNITNINQFNGRTTITTNLFVSNAFFTNITATTITNTTFYSSNAYISNLYVTNLTVQYLSNIFQTNVSFNTTNVVINQAIVTNLYVSNGYFTNITVNNAYISNAFITNEYVSNSFITNLTVNNNTVVSNLFVTNLFVSNAFLTNLTVNNNTVVSNLFVTNLFSSNAFFTNLTVNNNTFASNFYATNIFVSNAFLTNLTVNNNTFVSNLFATNIFTSNAFITNLTVNNTTIVSNLFVTNLFSSNAYITNLFSSNAFITNLYASNFFTTNAFISNAYITNLFTSNAFITNLTVQNITNQNLFVSNAFITNLTVQNFTTITTDLFVTNFYSSNAFITNLTVQNITNQNSYISNLFVTNIFVGSNLYTPHIIAADVTLTNTGAGRIMIFDSASNLVMDLFGTNGGYYALMDSTGTNVFFRLDTNKLVYPFPVLLDNLTVTNHITNVFLSTAGFVTNDASGGFHTTAIVPVGQLGPIVRTIDIPMGAWMTNNCGNGADVTVASMVTLTNSGDTPVFTVNATTTNEIRTRFSLPRDWDAGTVQLHTFWACTGTNSASASKTNIVVRYDAAAVGKGDRLDSLTFGTAVFWTNNVNPFPYEQGTEGITSALTVGNTPAAGKGIVWRIQVCGNAAGTTETNASLYISHFTLEYRSQPSNVFATPQ